MYLFLGIGFSFLAIGLLYDYFTRPFLNPYKLYMIFGKKGSGKSTLLMKLAIQYMQKGIKVYSTENIPGTYLIDYKDIGYKQFDPNSVILIDEVGMIWDNRNFKSFDPKVRDWFKLQRHYKCTVYLFSQTFDIDKKLRDLTDEMYLVEKKFRVFSYAKRILKRQVLHASTPDAPSRIDEDLEFDSLLLFWCGSRRLTYLPKYAPYFDSFAAPTLEAGEWQQSELPDSLRKKFFRPKRSKFGGSLPSLSSLIAKTPLRKRGRKG